MHNLYVEAFVWTSLLVALAALPVLSFLMGFRRGVEAVRQRTGVTVSSSGNVVLTAAEQQERAPGAGPLTNYANLTEAGQ